MLRPKPTGSAVVAASVLNETVWASTPWRTLWARAVALEAKPSHGFAHRGDQQDPDNDGYGVSSSLHRSQ